MPGRGGGRGPLPRPVQVSKKISWLLRHGAEEEGLQLDTGGFLNVQDVLANRKIRSLKVTFSELRAIVEENDKQRFSMVPVAAAQAIQEGVDGKEGVNGQLEGGASEKPEDWLIRANQGHSLKVEDEGLLKPFTVENAPEVAVHGTTHAAWPLIVASGGLRPMNRNHVHFASGLPAGFQSLKSLDGEDRGAGAAVVDAPVISGMRKSSTVLMFLDVRKALEAGLKFGISDNGVILSEGNTEGMIPLEMFARVEDRTGEGVLLEEGKVVKEAPAHWAAKGRGKG